MGTEQRLERIEAREKIERTVYNYVHGLDKRNKDLFATVWTEDAQYLIGGSFGECIGRKAILDAFDGFGVAFYEMHHFTTNLVVDGPDGDHASAISDVLVTTTDSEGTPGLSAATYHDKFRRENDAWPFYERAIVIHYHVKHLEPQGINEASRIYLTPEVLGRLTGQ